MSGATEPTKQAVGHALVTCRDCGVEYVCTPQNDYYNFTTATDGVCLSCLLKPIGITKVVEVDMAQGVQP